MRIVIIDDDAVRRGQYREWAGKILGVEPVLVDNAMDANDVAADVYLLDLSAVSGLLDMHNAYSPICRLVEDHPGAVFALVSGTGRATAESVIDDVDRLTGTRPIYAGTGAFAAIERALLDEIGREEA